MQTYERYERNREWPHWAVRGKSPMEREKGATFPEPLAMDKPEIAEFCEGFNVGPTFIGILQWRNGPCGIGTRRNRHFKAFL